MTINYVDWQGVYSIMEKGWRMIPLKITGNIKNETIEKEIKKINSKTKRWSKLPNGNVVINEN